MEIHRNYKRSKRKNISIFKTILTNQIIYIYSIYIHIYTHIYSSSPPLFKFSFESLIPQPFPELLQQNRKHLIVAATCHDFGNAIQRYTYFQFNSHRLMQNNKKRCKSSSMRKEWKKERRVKRKEDPLQGSRRPRYSPTESRAITSIAADLSQISTDIFHIQYI